MEAMEAMDRTYGFYPTGTRNPFIRKLISSDNCVLVYDGYFYVDVADLPVQRIMVTYGEPVPNDTGGLCYTATSAAHIEIYEKISGEDTSFRQSDRQVQEQEQEQSQNLTVQEQEQSQNLTVQETNQDLPVQDASQEDDDESDDYDICFFPTEITTLKYRVLKSNLTSQEQNMLELVIKEQTKTLENRRINEMMASLKTLDD